QFLGLVEAGAWFTDEARFGGTPPEVKQMDLRAVREEAAAWQPTYLNLHRAREGAERAAKALASFNTKDPRVGEMYAISALVHILLAEDDCSGVPFSTTEPALVYGDPQTTTQTFQRAIARLDLAKQNANGDATVTNLEAVLRGRAFLNLAKNQSDLAGFTAAAAAVASVPDNFVYRTYHSTATGRENNFMYQDIFNADRLSVSDREGVNGLPFGSSTDPRLPLEIPTANNGRSLGSMAAVRRPCSRPARTTRTTSCAAPTSTSSSRSASETTRTSRGAWIATLEPFCHPERCPRDDSRVRARVAVRRRGRRRR